MKRFHFRLQKLLDIREQVENKQQTELAKAAAEYQRLILKKDDAYTNIEESRKHMSIQMRQNDLSILELQAFDKMQQNAERFAFALQPEIEKAKQKMDQERQKYHKAKQDKRAIEILKEQEMKKYKQYVNRKEIEELDEMAKTIYQKHHGEES